MHKNFQKSTVGVAVITALLLLLPILLGGFFMVFAFFAGLAIYMLAAQNPRCALIAMLAAFAVAAVFCFQQGPLVFGRVFAVRLLAGPLLPAAHAPCAHVFIHPCRNPCRRHGHSERVFLPPVRHFLP